MYNVWSKAENCPEAEMCFCLAFPTTWNRSIVFLLFLVDRFVLLVSLWESCILQRGTIFAMLLWLAFRSDIAVALGVVDGD